MHRLYFQMQIHCWCSLCFIVDDQWLMCRSIFKCTQNLESQAASSSHMLYYHKTRDTIHIESHRYDSRSYEYFSKTQLIAGNLWHSWNMQAAFLCGGIFRYSHSLHTKIKISCCVGNAPKTYLSEHINYFGACHSQFMWLPTAEDVSTERCSYELTT